MDISTVCIQQMGDRNKKQRPQMKWEVMDVRELKYQDEMFDLVIDKSTIDALLCGNFAYLNVAIMLKECQRVLKTGGYYMAISYGVPDNREFHLIREHLKLEINTYKIEKNHEGTNATSVHYIYVAKKLEGADKQCSEKWSQVMNQIKMEMEDA
jgi:EEF1A lysine methyltransferase 4